MITNTTEYNWTYRPNMQLLANRQAIQPYSLLGLSIIGFLITIIIIILLLLLILIIIITATTTIIIIIIIKIISTTIIIITIIAITTTIIIYNHPNQKLSYKHACEPNNVLKTMTKLGYTSLIFDILLNK